MNETAIAIRTDTERPSNPVDSDEVLVDRIRMGDLAACEGIMRRYNRRLFRIARSVVADDHLAEDVLQESYIRAFTKIDSFQSGNFPAWLGRIVLNEARMLLRKRRRETSVDDPESYIAAPTNRMTIMNESYGPFHATANAELAGHLEQAIDRLPENFRSVFVLRAVEQLSVNETARMLALPEATVKTRFHRARKMIGDAMAKRMDICRADVFEFAGRRCDRMVEKVRSALGQCPRWNTRAKAGRSD